MLWFAKLLIRFFSSIDKTLFNFIGTLYELLIDISRTSILSQGDIAEFANRVELMLGIFMLFKITFSLITYIVNPDDFSDKSKGFGKLISRSVISLVMLVLVPYVFQMAYTLQSKVLEDNILPKLILGENIVDNDEEYDEGTSDASKLTIMDTAGQRMAFQVMLPFFSPRYSIGSLSACTNLYDDSHTFSADCKSALQASGMSDKELNNYVYGIENESLGLTFRTNTALAATSEDDDAEFLIDYKYPLSTVAAVVVCLILITFCIDIGLRSVKLAFLQLIYPIPVIGYMDPKAGGNDGIFKKWYKMCLSTFLSLFIRLLALYFGIYIIDKVADFGFYDVTTGAQITNPWVNLFIIIGVLMFVKQLPNILKNMGLNIEGDGSFSLNPLKKIEKGAIGGKTLSRVPKAAVGAATGLGIGTIGAFTGAGAGRGLTGLFSGMAAGMQGKKLGEIRKSQVDKNAAMRKALDEGSSFFGRRGAQLSSFLGSPGALGHIAEEKNALQHSIEQEENAKKAIEDRISPQRRQIKNNSTTTDAIKSMQDRAVQKIKEGNGAQGRAYKRLLAIAAQAEADGDGARAERIRQQAETRLHTEFRDAWIDKNLNSANGDVELKNRFNTYATRALISGHNVENTASELDKQSKKISTDTNVLKNSIAKFEQDILEHEDAVRTINVRMQEINDRERVAKANIDAVHGTPGGPGSHRRHGGPGGRT